jgi:hypothetical protein
MFTVKAFDQFGHEEIHQCDRVDISRDRDVVQLFSTVRIMDEENSETCEILNIGFDTETPKIGSIACPVFHEVYIENAQGRTVEAIRAKEQDRYRNVI